MIVVCDMKEVVWVKVFVKDGSCYIFCINNLNSSKCFVSDYFVFSKVKYLGYYIEDL